MSSVVCRPFPGDGATDAPRFGIVGCIFAFLVRACVGDGELARSSVSIVSSGGGETDRLSSALKSAGSVFERCIGARLLLFVTLAGKSSSTGVSDFSLNLDTGAGLLCCRTGDDESRSTTAASDCANGATPCSLVFANTREDREPGFVTFAKL